MNPADPTPCPFAEAVAAEFGPRHCQPGSLFSFVPVHGESRVGAVLDHLGRTWREDLGLSVSLAAFGAGDGLSGLAPEKIATLLERARFSHDIVSVDLTEAREPQALEVLRASSAIFIVSTSGQAALEMAGRKIAWLGTFGLRERCGVLLTRVTGGLRADQAEEVAAAPVCGLAESGDHLHRLAHWLGAGLGNRSSRPASPPGAGALTALPQAPCG